MVGCGVGLLLSVKIQKMREESRNFGSTPGVKRCKPDKINAFTLDHDKSNEMRGETMGMHPTYVVAHSRLYR